MKMILLSAVLLVSAAALPAAEIEAGGLGFTSPEEWKASEPSSPMRAAELAVPGEAGPGEVVFFYFGPGGAGGVEANVQRWFGQFKEPKDRIGAKTEKAVADGNPVTFVSAEGTFLAGPPRGPKEEKPGHALLGAIVEHEKGPVFVKFTGPAATVEANTAAFKTMVTGAE